MAHISKDTLKNRPTRYRQIKLTVTGRKSGAWRMPVFVFFLAALSYPRLQAQTLVLAPAKRRQIEDAVTEFMSANKLPSASVAVVENGEYEWSDGFGMADLENFVPATPHTLYRLASVSKTITAVAALLLYQRDKLDLDAPVQNYCPTFPKKQFPITTRQLLGHLGGIRHYRTHSVDDPEILNLKHFDEPIAGGLSFFKDDPLLAQPGAPRPPQTPPAFSYSPYRKCFEATFVLNQKCLAEAFPIKASDGPGVDGDKPVSQDCPSACMRELFGV